MPAWLDYQKLAATVYTALERNAVVTHDDKILGIKSGLLRQIDVSLRLKVAGHDLLIIVQAKDLARPADVNVVGEFSAVVDDVQAAKGVLICSSGFTEAATEYAKACTIDLCSAYDAASPKWALSIEIPVLWVEHKLDLQYDILLRPDQTNESELSVDTDPRKWPVSLDNGVSYGTFGKLIERRLVEKSPSYELGERHEIRISLENARVLLGGTFSCPIDGVDLAYTVIKCGWSGTTRLSNVLGLLNRTTSTLQALVRLTDKDIPLARDASWQPVENIEEYAAAHPNLITVECSAPTFSQFEAHNAAMDRFEVYANVRNE